MSHRPLVALAALTLTVTTLVQQGPGLPTARAAVSDDPVSHVLLTDPVGDVWSISEGEDEEWAPTDDAPGADVVRATVRHGRHNLRMRMTFADLRRVEGQHYTATVVHRTGYGALFVSTGPRRWGGRHVLVDEQFGKVRCPGLDHTIDYATERVTMTIPRRCLDRPAWVRVGLDNFMFRESAGAFQEVTDNPHTATADGRLTGRLHRVQ